MSIFSSSVKPGAFSWVSVQFAYDFVNRIIQRLHTPSLNVRCSLRQMRVHAALCFQFFRSQFFRIHVLLTP